MITKSNYMQFLRCTCELWVMKQRKDLAPPIDAALQRLFDEGNKVDAFAQKLFPEGISVDGFGTSAAQKTKQAIEAGATILFQPTFLTKDLSCRGDILVKNGDAWDIYEVKSSTQTKEEHKIDVAFQRICLEESGYKVGKTFIVHINNQYVRHGEIDPQKLFTIDDVTDEALSHVSEIKQLIPEALEVTEWSTTPGALHLKSCRDPYKCEYLTCYISEFEDDHVYSIAKELSPDRLMAFLERGLIQPSQVPPELLKSLGLLDLPSEEKEPVISIDKEAIERELSKLQFPLYFFDYETWFPAIPPFDGYRPYQQIPFQYSLHILREPDGELEHVEFLAEHQGDPILDLTKALQSHIAGRGTFISWNAKFEMMCNRQIGERHPEYADFFTDINDRMFDLMQIVKQGYYVDSRFGGSASIKKVLPVVVPELSYKNLNIQEGGTASSSWPVLTDPAMPADQKAQLKKDMLEYCALDTFAMVEIYRFFSSL